MIAVPSLLLLLLKMKWIKIPCWNSVNLHRKHFLVLKNFGRKAISRLLLKKKLRHHMSHITYLNGIGCFLFWAFIRYVYDQHYMRGKFTSKTGETFCKGILFLRSYTRISSQKVFTSLMNYLNIVLCLYILGARNSTVNKKFPFAWIIHSSGRDKWKFM